VSTFPGVTVPAGMTPGSASAPTVPTNLPAGAATDYNALFEALLELRWKDISLPYTRFVTRLRQDLAIHKLTDRDAAHVEGTGRAPLEFTARIPLLNGLIAAQSEHWQRPLYPFTWRKLFAACSDKSTGTLQHPELGDVTCKLVSMESVWDGNVRSGVWVDITWLETDDQSQWIENAINSASPLANVSAFAGDLDVAQASIDPSVYPQPYTPPTSFDDLANQVVAVFDIPTLLSKQYQGQIANIVYEAQRVIDSANQAENSSLNWPLILSGYGIISAAYDAAATQLNSGQPIGTYTVQKDSTLAQVAAVIPAPVDSIMQLNPNYAGLTIIPKDSVIRYYAAAYPSAA
jgi:hypothetical protein